MKKNGYKISTCVLALLLIVTLGFLLYTTRKPPTIYGGFTNTATPGNALNPHVEISCGTKPKYAIYVDGQKFERGTYKRVSNSTFTLKDTDDKESGVVFLSNNGSYLYHSKLKKKLINIKKLPGKPTEEPINIH